MLTATDKFVKNDVRTSDIVTLSWINPAGVPLPVTGVDPRITNIWPVDGKFTLINRKIAALGELAGISVIPTPPTYPSDETFERIKRIDQDYWLRWLFKYGGNFEPPPNALPDERSIDGLVAAVTRYKLLYRCQFRYTMTDDALFPQIDSQSLYTVHQFSAIGSTTNPIQLPDVPGFPSVLPGVAGPANIGSVRVATILGSDFRLIGATSVTDGTPDHFGVNAFNSLTVDLGVRWNHIGMAIESLYGDRGASYVYNQKYPTYYIYSSGKLIEKRPQAPDPIMNFSQRPYPDAIGSTAPFVRPKIRFYSP